MHLIYSPLKICRLSLLIQVHHWILVKQHLWMASQTVNYLQLLINNSLSQITQEVNINAISNVRILLWNNVCGTRIYQCHIMHWVSTCIFDSFDCCGLKFNRGLKLSFQMNGSMNHMFPRRIRDAHVARAVSAKAHGNWQWGVRELGIGIETASTCTRAGQTWVRRYSSRSFHNFLTSQMSTLPTHI